ncbi:Murein DD-endopeptidase MepM and murein hydrolase activator NlpD, contain LysM domain [Pelagirhabdus alkalitolerans]|uniref:Murein DD-endopeptidase MepM and murein hydrolase activator NlpD, contain LysM domain n=1 Tax=Pelagirhabdus alkalitolerans TaxID=1612202 RepID=A0A1G6LT24_9BACI|nr:M23 family metallopeptidase [Pelagirhabdus alkalitolerans]SDC46341.1 Murein DD-endopeptidase MepM and murein hydrolase activator NlpD, contain LysM domain [Pelagirhabdus alkalitolerans]
MLIHIKIKLLILLVIFISFPLLFITEVRAESPEDIEQQIEENEEEMVQLDEETENISEEIVRMNASLQEKDKELGQIEQNIERSENEISETQDEIEKLNNEIIELEERIERREDIIGDRLRSMQQNDRKWGYLEVLFNSKDFSDLISRLSAITTIMEQDQTLYESQQTDLEDVEAIKVELSDQKASEEEQLAQLEEENEKLSEQINQVETAEAQLEEKLQANNLKIEELEQEQAQLAEKKEAQLTTMSYEEESGSSSDSSESNNVGSNTQSSAPSNAGINNSDSPFIWPTIGGVITSYQGPRWGSFHKGIDIARPDDYSILAADGGVITFSGWINGYGNTIEIDHQNGYTTQYAHLESKDVNVGDQVNQGDVIGIMGTTGRSTGIHLDFEVYHEGELLNPMDILP